MTNSEAGISALDPLGAGVPPVPKAALARVVSTAQEAAPAIERAGRRQNALLQSQTARAAAAGRGIGVRGGGGGLASGTLAMRTQRQAAAQAAQTAKEAQGARLQAAQVGLEAETELAAVAGQQVAEANAIFQDAIALDATMMASGYTQDERAGQISQHLLTIQQTMPPELAKETALNMLDWWVRSAGGQGGAGMTRDKMWVVYRAYGLNTPTMLTQVGFETALATAEAQLYGLEGGQAVA